MIKHIHRQAIKSRHLFFNFAIGQQAKTIEVFTAGLTVIFSHFFALEIPWGKMVEFFEMG